MRVRTVKDRSWPGADRPRLLRLLGLCSRYDWHVSSKSIREYLRLIGKRGGAAGTGSSKVRGDAEYYKRISRKAAKARKAKRKGSEK